MPKLTPEKVAQHMVGLLPQDGTPVLNRVMRVMLARELESPVDSELYFAARDLLLAQHRIGRLRGQGGQLFLTPDETTADVSPKPQPEVWAEAKLMEPLGRYLESAFRKGLDLPGDGLCLVQNTSSFGPHRGQWARPDYILVSASKLMPGSQVDVHSFELKTESGCRPSRIVAVPNGD